MRKLICLMLVLVMVASMTLVVSASTDEPQLIYSNAANSGVRDQLCLDLSGSTVTTYYTGDYTIDTLLTQSGEALLQNLRTLMKNTHHTQTTYSQCRDYSVITDCENGDGETINLLYTSYVATMADYINNTSNGGWNREHVWPKSLGGFSETGAGADLHHIRPTDKSVNSKRGNEKYGIPTNGQAVTGTATVAGAVGGYSDNQYFEPLDNTKGDVARICLYVYVRYGGDLPKCNAITNVFQSVDVLLQWHLEDPVDTWEMGRNEVVYGIQGNRNVFIDYPELAWLLFGEEIPQDLVSPMAGCPHFNTQLENALEATCGTAGYTGDTYCTLCGECVIPGAVIDATGDHTFSDWTTAENGQDTIHTCSVCGLVETQEAVCAHTNLVREGIIDPSCTELGFTGDIYCGDCGAFVAKGASIAAAGAHNFSDWTVQEHTASRICRNCGHKESVPAESLGIPEEKKDFSGVITAVVLIAVGGGLALIVVKKKKN